MRHHQKKDRNEGEVHWQLDDWNRGLMSSAFMQDQEPCPICKSRWRHLCDRCITEIEGTWHFALLKAREQVTTLALELMRDPAKFVAQVREQELTCLAVRVIDEAIEEGQQESWVTLAKEEILKLLCAVLDEVPTIRNETGDCPQDQPFESVSQAPGGATYLARELAAKNLPRLAPNPDFLESRLNGLLEDPQRGVKGWSALHLTGLCPENIAAREIVRQMLHWEGSSWGNGLGAWEDSLLKYWDWPYADAWCHLAFEAWQSAGFP